MERESAPRLGSGGFEAIRERGHTPGIPLIGRNLNDSGFRNGPPEGTCQKLSVYKIESVVSFHERRKALYTFATWPKMLVQVQAWHSLARGETNVTLLVTDILSKVRPSMDTRSFPRQKMHCFGLDIKGNQGLDVA